jgi:hypothetical protein
MLCRARSPSPRRIDRHRRAVSIGDSFATPVDPASPRGRSSTVGPPRLPNRSATASPPARSTQRRRAVSIDHCFAAPPTCRFFAVIARIPPRALMETTDSAAATRSVTSQTHFESMGAYLANTGTNPGADVDVVADCLRSL